MPTAQRYGGAGQDGEAPQAQGPRRAGRFGLAAGWPAQPDARPVPGRRRAPGRRRPGRGQQPLVPPPAHGLGRVDEAEHRDPAAAHHRLGVALGRADARRALEGVGELPVRPAHRVPGGAARVRLEADGVYREYSEPRFHTRKVLRGGSWTTPARLLRATFRNFYPPDRGNIWAGFRTCAW